ncbi:MAG: hypothetical protein ACSHWU_01505 [Marinicella sp.]
MKISNWQDTDSQFIYSLSKDELISSWDQLHAADQEKLPSGAVLDAWLLFHNGYFADAANAATELAAAGVPILIRSVVAFTDYICEDEDECTDLLEQAYIYGESYCDESSDCQFTTALAMGRYSQSISITKALTKGLGGKVKNLLTSVLKNQPNHAEAHLAMAMYHAEIIDKVGATLGGLTYGAKAKVAEKHLSQALELVPNAINLIEAGNAVLLLQGDDGMDDATAYYEQAAAIEPLDSLQSMDVDFAASQLEE